MVDRKQNHKDEDIYSVLMIIKEHQIAPLVVSQRVLAVHPKTKNLHTASLLTSDVQQFHAQFDKTDLGVAVIADTHLFPISGNQYYQRPNSAENSSSQLHLNNIRNIYLYNKFASQTAVSDSESRP